MVHDLASELFAPYTGRTVPAAGALPCRALTCGSAIGPTIRFRHAAGCDEATLRPDDTILRARARPQPPPSVVVELEYVCLGDLEVLAW